MTTPQTKMLFECDKLVDANQYRLHIVVELYDKQCFVRKDDIFPGRNRKYSKQCGIKNLVF